MVHQHIQRIHIDGIGIASERDDIIHIVGRIVSVITRVSRLTLDHQVIHAEGKGGVRHLEYAQVLIGRLRGHDGARSALNGHGEQRHLDGLLGAGIFLSRLGSFAAIRIAIPSIDRNIDDGIAGIRGRASEQSGYLSCGELLCIIGVGRRACILINRRQMPDLHLQLDGTIVLKRIADDSSIRSVKLEADMIGLQIVLLQGDQAAAIRALEDLAEEAVARRRVVVDIGPAASVLVGVIEIVVLSFLVGDNADVVHRPCQRAIVHPVAVIHAETRFGQAHEAIDIDGLRVGVGEGERHQRPALVIRIAGLMCAHTQIVRAAGHIRRNVISLRFPRGYVTFGHFFIVVRPRRGRSIGLDIDGILVLLFQLEGVDVVFVCGILSRDDAQDIIAHGSAGIYGGEILQVSICRAGEIAGILHQRKALRLRQLNAFAEAQRTIGQLCRIAGVAVVRHLGQDKVSGRNIRHGSQRRIIAETIVFRAYGIGANAIELSLDGVGGLANGLAGKHIVGVRRGADRIILILAKNAIVVRLDAAAGIIYVKGVFAQRFLGALIVHHKEAIGARPINKLISFGSQERTCVVSSF